ncbi:MFS transporter [Nocardia inohanensis]|uniref:MFS transporter n=1 Tax=Nocardia inohanensis TaxID=209246 RepID=UPI000833F430|nr:MFS transporter [Nocardia inohanensis]
MISERGAVSPLRQLAATPGLVSVLVWGFAGRLHLSATLFALLVMATEVTGSYAAAGVVSGALVLGQGITAPLRGRVVDRRPAARYLATTSALYGCGVAALAAVPAAAGMAPLVVAAFAVGCCCPPGTQISRAKVSQLARGAVRQRAFAVQATANELVLVTGPGATALVIAAVGARGAVVVSGLLAVAGGVGLALAVRRAGIDRPPPEHPAGHGGRSPLRVPGVARSVLSVTLFVTCFAMIDFVLIAWSYERGTPALGGVLIGVWAVGSVLGGLAATLWLTGGGNPRARMAVVGCGVALLIPALSPALTGGRVWPVGLALLLGGALIPPALAVVYDVVGDAAGPACRAEVFGWIASGTTAATAVANPLSGLLVDRWGAVAAAVAAAGMCGLAAGCMGRPPVVRAAPS